MSYSDDAVKAKLSALNETQDSIVTVAQWIMFHRRHADKTASIWYQRLQDSNTAKRLNLIYLANEVVQQSRARNKSEFLFAFEPLVVDAATLAYKNASQEVQGKVSRVVQVWRQRNIFDPQIQSAVETRLQELDNKRGGQADGGGKIGGKLGGSLFGGSAGSLPSALDGVAKSHASVSQAEVAVGPAVGAGMKEYDKITDPSTAVPTPPLYCARLSNVMKSLATAQGKVEESIQARKQLIKGLEDLLASNRAKLDDEQPQAADLQNRKERIEAMKKDVEDYIMQGLSTPSDPNTSAPPAPSFANQINGTANKRSSSGEIKRSQIFAPDAERFTPPPPDVETFTPPPAADEEALEIAQYPSPLLGSGNLPSEHEYSSTTGTEAIQEMPPKLDEPPPAFQPPAMLQTQDSAAEKANEFLNSLNVSRQTRQASTEIPDDAGASRDPRLKRRKTGHDASPKREVPEEEMFASGMVGMDEEGISALLNS